MYERAFLVRAREEKDQSAGVMEPSMVHEVDSPFSMDQIKTSIMDEEPARERANLIRIREPNDSEQVNHLGLTKSEPILVEADIKANCKVAEPTAWGIETQESGKTVTHAMEILSQKDFSVVKLGTLPGCSARIVWRENGSMYAEEGIPFLPTDDDNELPLDDEMPEMFDKKHYTGASGLAARMPPRGGKGGLKDHSV